VVRVLEYVSGSAYKIVNTRAYHHGTMLISTELGKLGSLLHNTKVDTYRQYLLYTALMLHPGYLGDERGCICPIPSAQFTTI
jgi:Lipoyl protein ligase A/B catalytic domain